jgi:hypothetical protein
MLVLEGPCGVISVHVKLGEKREVIIMGVTILMSFDVLEGQAEGELLERTPVYFKNIPIGARVEDGDWLLVVVGEESKGVHSASSKLVVGKGDW